MGVVMIDKCPECGLENFKKNGRGEIICKECGLVIDEDTISEDKEYRTFDQNDREKKERTGSSLTYTRHDKGISSKIGRGNSEIDRLPQNKRKQYYRLRKWHNRANGSKNRNLRSAFSFLNGMISSLGLPKKVHEEIARLYEKAVDKKLVRGKAKEEVICALIYTVARNNETPRAMREISKEAGIKKRDLGKTYRDVARELDLRIRPTKASYYVPRLVSKLQASGEVQAKALELAKKVYKDKEFSGNSPIGVASACVYTSCKRLGYERTQREVSNIADVTKVTIRNRTKEIEKHIDLDKIFGKAEKGNTNTD